MSKVRNNFAWEIVLIACNLRLAIIILTPLIDKYRRNIQAIYSSIRDTYYDTIIMFWFYIDINFFVN